MSAAELIEAALKLNHKDRAELVEAVSASLERGSLRGQIDRSKRVSRRVVLACLALVAVGCGGRARGSNDEDPPSNTPTFEESILAEGIDLRFEAISDDGDLVAYSEAAMAGGREIWVVPTEGGAPERLGLLDDLDSARFDRTTLLLFRGDGVPDASARSREPCSDEVCGPHPDTWSPELFAWRPGDAGLTSLATDVDPGSVRFSRDGRWISLEANDLPEWRSFRPDIMLVDTRDLSVRRLGAANVARARFTRQSDWLVFSAFRIFEPAPDIAAQLGAEPPCDWHRVLRLSLHDGRVVPVTCYQALERSRWEISRDGEWLVHGLYPGVGYVLARTPIAGGKPETLARDFASASVGKSFDVGGGNQPQVAFLTSAGGQQLSVIPLEPDRAPQVLAGGCTDEASQQMIGPWGIAEHHGQTITYHGCDALHAVPARGGESVSLGLYSRLLDEQDERLLALDATGALHLYRVANNTASTLGQEVNAARFMAGERVLASTGSGAPPWSLILFDAAGVNHALGEITGPFGIEPAGRRFFVTTRDVDGKSRVVVGR
jgi:hypothetical protein